MQRLNRFSLVFSFGVLIGVVPASAFVALGHGRLVGTVTARADYDSNIFVNDSEVDDYFGTLTGAVRFVQDSSAVNVDAGAGVTVYTFADHSALNSADPYFDATLSYAPSDKTELRGGLSLKRNSIGNETLNDRTESNDLSLDAQFQHLTTEKLGVRLNATYGKRDYMTAGYSDVLDYSLGVQGVHVYSPKLKLLAGLTMHEWWTDNRSLGRRSPASRDWRYSGSAEGELAPKISGDVSAGLVHREASLGFDDQDALYLGTRLTWAAAERTNVSLLISQDFSVSAADQSVKSLSAGLSLSHTLTEKMVFEGYAGIDRSRFQSFGNVGNRDDEGYSLRGRLGYNFTETVAFDVSGGFRHSDSNQKAASYDRFSFGFGASVRF